MMGHPPPNRVSWIPVHRGRAGQGCKGTPGGEVGPPHPPGFGGPTGWVRWGGQQRGFIFKGALKTLKTPRKKNHKFLAKILKKES